MASKARVAPGAGGLLFLPYFSGERTPINDPQARGVIAGLSLAHTREQLFRAILEGVACGVRHNVETLAQIGAEVKRVVAVGGGAQTDIWLQIVSDVAGLRQEVPAVTVGACYGDAFTVERPTDSGRHLNLYQVAEELARCLTHIFLKDADGRRPVFGGTRMFHEDPHWRDVLLFYEYFHGNHRAGLGASSLPSRTMRLSPSHR